ncbi:MAG TPA: LUD domain-containing protein [Bryobacteraceae bacterium]|nr:LUD domain-containing protein [Bryobacteraceae bacterium]
MVVAAEAGAIGVSGLNGHVSARAGVLAKIRHAVGDHTAAREAEYASIPREYRRQGGSGREDVVELLAGRLRDYDAHVYHCGPHEVAQTVASAMAERGKTTLLRSGGLPAEWLPSSYQFPVVDGMTYEEVDQAEGVITGCVTAIALTGTIILRHGPQDSRRALTLIPDYHLCVVFAEQVVETVPEGFERLRGMETLPLTTVSGPSATADIEMTRVKGVHGPRFLDVILVG